MSDTEHPANAPSYLYERGEHRRKHCWNRDEAAFLPGKRRGGIGKCPNSITDEIAQELLAGAIGYYDAPEEQENPSALYNVYRGVPYEAVPTRSGISYHGFPWQGRMPERILEQLGERAMRDGYERQFKAWVKKYSKR